MPGHNDELAISSTVLIVVPQRETAFCGLADHAEVIAAALQSHGLQSRIVTFNQARLDHSCAPVLIQFTPLAYSKVGVPLSLLLATMRWRFVRRRVVIYFHELPFCLKPSLRQALAASIQWGVSLLLTLASSAVVVNQRRSAAWLRLASPFRKPLFLPSVSNIGQADDSCSPLQRPLQVIVFGSPGKRRHSHQMVQRLGGYQQVFGAGVSVLEIGDFLGKDESPPTDVQCMGPLPRQKVFELLLHSRFGLFYSEPHQFSKSGVFAAYCATGVVPVIAVEHSSPSRLYLSPGEFLNGSINAIRIDQVSHQCRIWAQQFSASECASKLSQLLQC